MSIEDDIYKEIILENYKATRNKRAVEQETHHAEGANPSCGDDLELHARVADGRIEDIAYEGMGCSICCASANLLCETVRGKSFEAAEDLISRYRSMLLEEADPAFPDEAGDLEAMQGVKKYPVRIKCALLAWNTLSNMLGGAGDADHTDGADND
ncbi:MAG: Fe-S cluster assembly sulfur transfer protein SufU [Spirochaetaceae bacterium]